MKRLVNVFSLTDSFRTLYPLNKIYSRYYSNEFHGEGATRIDRLYHYGEVVVIKAQYQGVAFSDHHCHVIEYKLPDCFSKLLSPISRPRFKANPSTVKDSIFKIKLKEKYASWLNIKDKLNIMEFWEYIVKPGVKKLLIEREKELKKERRGRLNFLLIH